MSAFDGNEIEMERFHKLGSDEVEAILSGAAPRSPLTEYVERLRTVDTVDEATASAHIAVAAEAVRLAPARRRATRRDRWRRRTVFGSFITTVLAKVLAASVALAAVTGGVGAISNSAAPGDPLYRIDTLMERIGLFNGGAHERLQEAERLVVRDRVYQGLELAETAIGDLHDGYGPAAAALEQAAVQVQTRTQTSAQYRDDITEMLRIMTRQMEMQQVQQVTETAEQVRETTREMVGQPTEPSTSTGGQGSGQDGQNGAGPGGNSGGNGGH